MLSEEDRRFLLSQAAVRRYRRGHPIFSKGDDATCLFFVLAGEIEIFIVNGCGRTVIARTEVGELFGGLELLSGQQRTASAVAIRDSLLGVIYQGGLERAMTARPELLTAIIRDLAATVAEITMRLSTLSLLPPAKSRANLEAPLCANHASPAHRRRPLAVGAYTLLEQQTLFDPTCKSPPPSEPANRWFLRQSGTGRMTRSTGLLSSSMRPSSRRRESAGHRVSALRIASAGSPRAFFVRFWSRHSRARLAAGRSSWRRARVAKPFPT
jgi:CRP-like cAMP-binding protein